LLTSNPADQSTASEFFTGDEVADRMMTRKSGERAAIRTFDQAYDKDASAPNCHSPTLNFERSDSTYITTTTRAETRFSQLPGMQQHNQSPQPIGTTNGRRSGVHRCTRIDANKKTSAKIPVGQLFQREVLVW
jgi:hypothetical protein